MDMEITFPGGKKVDANYKNFTIKTDQSIIAGGENSAPAPFDYFLASIGTCAGIYVLSFCQQRKIPTDNIKLVQRLIIDELTKQIDTIVLEIQVPEDFPERYKNALIKSAKLCAVKKHIEQPPLFEISTKVV